MKERPILVHEVGPRDGLQVEELVVPTEQKLEWVQSLAASGVDLIQVGSFVHPRKVPQMADTDELFRRLARPGVLPSSVRLTALVLNEKGVDRGFACGVSDFCMGVSASDTHSRKNTGMSTKEALSRILAMARRVVGAGKRVQVSVQSAFGCGYEGPIPEARVMDLAQAFLDAGFTTVSLADTAGHADPAQVERLFGRLLEAAPGIEVACHLHDTYGLGLANAYAAIRAGVTVLESAFGGLGGCPFTAVAGGNVCTEDLVHMLHRMGLRSDIQLGPIVATTRRAEAFFGRKLPGTIYKTGPIPAPGEEAS